MFWGTIGVGHLLKQIERRHQKVLGDDLVSNKAPPTQFTRASWLCASESIENTIFVQLISTDRAYRRCQILSVDD